MDHWGKYSDESLCIHTLLLLQKVVAFFFQNPSKLLSFSYLHLQLFKNSLKPLFYKLDKCKLQISNTRRFSILTKVNQ